MSEQAVDADIARRIAEILRADDHDREPGAVLQRLVDAMVANLASVDYAGVTMLDHGELTSHAVSDPLVSKLDDLQHRLREGPCVETARSRRSICVGDLRAEQRWPEFVSSALELGVAAILSVELFATDSVSAALNLYAVRPSAFGPEDADWAVMLAAPAGIAVSAHRKIENLGIALDSRDLIGQAKGILMERHKISAQEAFDLLVVVSQRTNRKLREIAEELAETGELAVPRRRTG